ncbi:MAG: hypothetical protein GTO29_03810 [Candidatus Latescibacteria bacterium]|nr:hypothetical protein [Candidatus Latescibacterota bacterium]NIO55201.1 hypothetical protein [Candidatus Latescibacterota bacterium]
MDRLLRRKAPTRVEDLHFGHVAALGAKLAAVVFEHGMRHTAITREHLLWSEKDGGFRLAGSGNMEKLNWPRDVRIHTSDIRTFQLEFGSAATSALRLGYIYQLGPIAEWLFYGLPNASGTENHEEPPALLREQWSPPEASMALGESSELSQEEASLYFEQGIAFRKRGEHSAAKRAFLRCFLAGTAAQELGLEVRSVVNLSTIYLDEQRFQRALGLAIIASMMVDKDDRPAWDLLGSLVETLQSQLLENDQKALSGVIERVAGMLPAEAMWQVDDREISGMLLAA